jgi:type IV pilus assembly protein PilW
MSDSRLIEMSAATPTVKRPVPRQRRFAALRLTRGFSLIELMVSLTIGLVIAVAAVAAYLGTAGASKLSDAQARMNEDGQAALTILSQQIRMAGNNPDQRNRTELSRRNPVYGATTYPLGGTYTTSNFTLRGCNGPFGNVTATTATNLDNLTCVGGTSTLPDSIAVNYEADRYNTVPTTTGLATDCLGIALGTVTASLPTVVTVGTATSTVTSVVSFAVADNRFFIGTSGVVVAPSLFCHGNGGGAPQPMVENVEDMQFSYGTVSTATTATTATVAGYLSSDGVVTEASLALLPNDAARWGKVLTVRICVVVRSESPVLTNAGSSAYVKCDGTVDTTPTDLRLRKAYSTTVVLRNRLL